jgi:thymidine phosphorylase
MSPQSPGKKTASGRIDKVALITVGCIERKIPYVLYPLLLASDIDLSMYKNYGYPQDLSIELIQEFTVLLRKEKVENAVFDLRIQLGTDASHLRRARNLSRELQDICHDNKINNSIILSDGNQLIGAAVGTLCEMIEAREVLEGKGPPDLIKFSIEIAADFLMMTKKTDQRIWAKKCLRDKILAGDLSPALCDLSKNGKFSSPKKGYIHHLKMDELFRLKSELANVHSEICFSLKKRTGDWVDRGEDLIEFYFPEGQTKTPPARTCQKIFAILSDPPNHQPLILERLGLDLHH